MSAGSFVKVPTELLYDPEIPAEVLRTYLALARNAIACSSDTFEMTGEQLGTLLGRTRRTAIRLLDDLQARGLVLVDGNRGRGRPNLITVLDPQGVVFAGLHVKRAVTSVSQEAVTEMSQPAVTRMSQPYREGREDESGQRRRGGADAPNPRRSVDNGGAPPTPRRDRCSVHEPPGTWSESTECRGCVADAKAAGYSRRPAF